MNNSLLLGVSIGESFAEFSLLSDSNPIAQKRIYLSRESLKASLAQFVSQNAKGPVSKAFVGLKAPRKLLDFRFSGAVAHITTDGFENWLEVCGNPAYPLTQKDLQFTLRERTLADGRIDTPLQKEELEAIAAKLELMNCKKVCLHLLHASINSTHQERAKKLLEEKGLEVFVPANEDIPNEVLRWNHNALNATLSGVFAELKADLFSGLEGNVDRDRIFFLNGEGKLTQNAGQEVSSLFAATSAMGLAHKNLNADILYLGLEQFVLISPTQWEHSWNSPWGAVGVRHLHCLSTGIQPTLGIHLNSFGRFDFNSQSECWEPGPMFLGRGQKMTLLDLWADNTKLAKLHGFEDRVSGHGVQRFKNSLLTLSKVSALRDNDIHHLTKELQSLGLQRLAMEIYLKRRQKKLTVMGPLAPVLANIFKKDPNTTLLEKDFCESEAIARLGAEAAKETP